MSSDTAQMKADVFIIGGGIIAATFARILVDGGHSVIMADAGGQHSLRAGENLKNFPTYQTDLDQFGGIVRGLMHPVSVPPAKGKPYTANALNPRQDPEKNLPGAVAAYNVGGMAIHWTCAIPRQHETLERPQFIASGEWNNLYTEAEGRLNCHTNICEHSLRHKALKRVLTERGCPVQDTPLAAERDARNPEFVRYTGTDTVLGPLADDGANEAFTLLREHRVSELRSASGRVRSAVLRDLRTKEEKVIEADAFVVAAGWVHTAQILWNSGIQRDENSALGRYLTDHLFTGCQVSLSDGILAEIEALASEGTLLSSNPAADPLPIPMNDAPFHLHLPIDEQHPWQGLIFREAFTDVTQRFDPETQRIDSRLVVDFKWFGTIDPNRENRMTFEEDIRDRIGMPQPTFHFELGAADRDREARMLEHMKEVASLVGPYLPTSQPTRVPLGASTHTMGATRMGEKDDGTSVVDPYSKVWGLDNLYVGGNCVLPTANAANPTLTSVVLAIRAARRLL